jgi:hypothetical protein
MSARLHRGQRDCRGHVVAPQLSHRLPTSWKFSSGQVDTSGASAFCTRRVSRTRLSPVTLCEDRDDQGGSDGEPVQL